MAQINCWMRDIAVILTSKTLNKQMIFGQNWKEGKEDLDITINGSKYLSALKDEFTIKIDNLTYNELLELVVGQYYDVEIKCGYRSSGIHTIFKGAILYISNDIESRKTQSIIILCASKLVAKYGQQRLSLGLNSGINMYSAINFLMRRAGVKNSNVSEEFKNRIIRESEQVSSTINSFIENFTQANNMLINSDSSYGNDVTIWSPYRTDTRLYDLTSNVTILVGGYPQLTSDGLSMSVLPSFNFMPGDTIKIDNSIINLGVYSKSEVFSNKGFYLDEDGKYMIFQLSYNLQNRGSEFSVRILAKSRGLMSKITDLYK